MLFNFKSNHLHEKISLLEETLYINIFTALQYTENGA